MRSVALILARDDPLYCDLQLAARAGVVVAAADAVEAFRALPESPASAVGRRRVSDWPCRRCGAVRHETCVAIEPGGGRTWLVDGCALDGTNAQAPPQAARELAPSRLAP